MQHEEKEITERQDGLTERIMTFKNYPSPCSVNPIKLARAGFYYVYYEYIVQCSCCKKVIPVWNSGDEPDNERFHESGCKFVNKSSSNTEIPGYSSYQPGHLAIHAPQDHQGVQGHSSSSLPVMKIAERCNQSIRPSTAVPSSSTSMASSSMMSTEEPTLYPSFHSSTSLSTLQPSTSNAPRSFETLDMRNAAHRLKTFEDLWPREHPFLNIRLLVFCGLFCIGEGDAVECFSCHVLISNWNRNDDPKNRHIEAYAACRFVKGEDCGDIPLPRDIRQRQLVLPYHQPHPSLRSPNTSQQGSQPSSLTSFNNRPVSQPTPDPQAETRPSVVFSSQSATGNLFSCQNPANPAMHSEIARRDSFIRNRVFRRSTNLRATNEDLARAGLYATGVLDNVRCWYCDGELEQFLPYDDPMIEHAKFFPECEFLLQQMGVEWVTNISMQFPDVPRPILPRRESLVLPPVVSSPAPLPPPPDEMRDPVVRRQMRQEMFEEGMRSRHVLQAQQMGFDIQDIENAVKSKIRRAGCYFQSFDSLMNALLERYENLNENEQEDEEMIAEGHSLHQVENDLQGRHRPYFNNIFQNNPEEMIVADELRNLLTPPQSPPSSN